MPRAGDSGMATAIAAGVAAEALLGDPARFHPVAGFGRAAAALEQRIRRPPRVRGIAVRAAASFPGLGPDHLRIAVRRPEENALLVAALKEALV